MSFRKRGKASFSKNFVQITDINFPSTKGPKVSSSKRAFEKYKPRGLFSEFYGISKIKFAANI